MIANLSNALTILWHDRTRYLPGVLAVTFSTVLIALQGELLMGQVVYASFASDNMPAELWVGALDAQSPLLVQPVPEAWLLRVAAQPEVSRAEVLFIGQGMWQKPEQAARESCSIIGFPA